MVERSSVLPVVVAAVACACSASPSFLQRSHDSAGSSASSDGGSASSSEPTDAGVAPCTPGAQPDAGLSSTTKPVTGGVSLPTGVDLRMPIAPGTKARITNAYGAGYHVNVDEPKSMNQFYALDIYPLPDGGFGEPVLAPADGVVRLVGVPPGGWSTCGNWVVMEHDFGDGHTYLSNICHVSATLVTAGQTVHAGDVIAKIGCSSDLGIPTSAAGCSPARWGPHVHVSFQRDASLGGGSYGGHAMVPELMDGYAGFHTGMDVVAKEHPVMGTASLPCAPAAPSGPCANVPSSANGAYCGSSRQNGFAGGDPATLYTCTDGETTSVACNAPCTLAPVGQADRCP